MIKCNIMFNHNQICLELVAAASIFVDTHLHIYNGGSSWKRSSSVLPMVDWRARGAYLSTGGSAGVTPDSTYRRVYIEDKFLLSSGCLHLYLNLHSVKHTTTATDKPIRPAA
jgi:hypothetical protein